MIDHDLLSRIVAIVANCPALWWLGVTGDGVEGLRRRAADRSTILKVATIFIVPVLTAMFSAAGMLWVMRTNQLVQQNDIVHVREATARNQADIVELRRLVIDDLKRRQP